MARKKVWPHQSLLQREDQKARLQQWAAELVALAEMLWQVDHDHGWFVNLEDLPQLTVEVTRRGREFVRFVRDEAGIVGVFDDDKPIRFANKKAAYDAAVKRRVTGR